MNRELDFIRDMFDGIAVKYDFLNRLLSMGQDVVWRYRMVESACLEKNSFVLDVACGTGDVTAEILKQKEGAVRIMGIDFSIIMLTLAKKKLQHHLESVQLIQANALCLPFSSPQFDAVFIAFGIRNIVNRKKALEEFYQVLHKKGKMIILELTQPQNPLLRKFYLLYFQRILPRVGSFFSKDSKAYTYLPASVLKFPLPEEFIQVMKGAGFKNLRFKTMTFGIVTLFVGEK